jgi:hypothetical protein
MTATIYDFPAPENPATPGSITRTAALLLAAGITQAEVRSLRLADSPSSAQALTSAMAALPAPPVLTPERLEALGEVVDAQLAHRPPLPAS